MAHVEHVEHVEETSKEEKKRFGSPPSDIKGLVGLFATLFALLLVGAFFRAIMSPYAMAGLVLLLILIGIVAFYTQVLAKSSDTSYLMGGKKVKRSPR